MVLYRRLKIAGGVYFFTVNLYDRRERYLTEHISLLSSAIRRTKEKMPFKTLAIVIMPDHLHTIWELPEGDNNYSVRWGMIKKYFTQSLLRSGVIVNSNNRRERDVWQRRFWEHAIRNERDYEQHVNYIHYNPVKHGLVRKVKEWKYSSFHRYVREGFIPKNWGELGAYSDLLEGAVGEQK